MEKSIQELRDIFIEISNLVSTQVTQVAPDVGEKLFWAVAGGQHWARYLKGVEILTKIGSGSIFYLDPNVMSSFFFNITLLLIIFSEGQSTIVKQS